MVTHTWRMDPLSIWKHCSDVKLQTSSTCTAHFFTFAVHCSPLAGHSHCLTLVKPKQLEKQTYSKLHHTALMSSLLQCKMVSTCSGRANNSAFHPVFQKIPRVCLWNNSNLGPFLFFWGRSSNASSFQESPWQANPQGGKLTPSFAQMTTHHYMDICHSHRWPFIVTWTPIIHADDHSSLHWHLSFIQIIIKWTPIIFTDDNSLLHGQLSFTQMSTHHYMDT